MDTTRNSYKIWYTGFIALALVIVCQTQLPTLPDVFIESRLPCFVDRSCDNLVTLNCPLSDTKIHYYPVEIPRGNETMPPEVLYIAPTNPGEYHILDFFIPGYSLHTHHSSLKRIIIRGTTILQDRSRLRDLKNVTQLHFVERYFENLANLEYLEISNSLSTSWTIQFKLPANLKTYNISRNEYTELSISGSSKLEDVDANNNHLTTFPKFINDGRPMPPLKKLHIKGIQLGNMMTVTDLAHLCLLQLLELEFRKPEDEFLHRAGYCNCTILKQWAVEAKFVIDSLVCYKPEANEKIECPTETYLGTARKIREQCLDPQKNVSTPRPRSTPASTPPTAIRGWLMHIVLFVLCLVMFVALIFFIVRRYYLMDSGEENSTDSSPSSVKRVEEEEDSLPESLSEEIPSS